MLNDKKARRLPASEDQHCLPEGPFISQYHGDLPRKRKGRPRGPTNSADAYIEETANHFREYYALPLMRAVQYAVDDLIRATRRVRLGNLNAFEAYGEPSDLVSIDHGELGLQSAKRAAARQRQRAQAGWSCLDDDYSICVLLGPPDVSKDDVAVKRNFERMSRV